MSHSFSKSHRLLKRYEYQKMHQSSTTLPGKFIVLDYSRGASSCPKLGITVTKKFGKAHDRNRFKRIIREAFRKQLPTLPANLQIHIRPRFLAKEACTLFIYNELQTLLHQSLLCNPHSTKSEPLILTSSSNKLS